MCFADVKGTKFALMLALLIYCFVAVTAAGFAPLELDPTADEDNDGTPDDAERYDLPSRGMLNQECTT